MTGSQCGGANDAEPARYSFHAVSLCNMCRSPATMQKVLGKRLNHSQGLFPKGKCGITTTIVRCQICGLVFSNPIPIPQDLQDHYGIAPDHYWKDTYFTIDPLYFLEQIKSFESLSGKAVSQNRLTALDIGAGIGKGMIALTRAGFDAYGIEPSEPFYQMAVEKMGISPAKIQLCGVEDAAFELGSFDFVSFGAVLEHLPDPSGAIQKALTLLKPDGLIHIEVPSSSWLIGRLGNLFYKLTGSDYVTNLSPMHPPFHLYEFGLLSFLRDGQINGYRVASHRYHVCQTYLPALISPVFTSWMKLTGSGMQLEVWLSQSAKRSSVGRNGLTP